MKTYAAQGFEEFVICAGYKSEIVKQYFLNYASYNRDITVQLKNDSTAVFHSAHDEESWTVTVADTGPLTPTGGRIKLIQPYTDGDSFLCTYGDGLAPVNLKNLIEKHRSLGSLATLTCANPPSRFGIVKLDGSGFVRRFEEKKQMDSFVNIGYFIFEPEIFEFLDDSSILETEVLPVLAEEGKLGAFQHLDFWYPMDTQRDLHVLQELWENGNPPWKIW
jgi:glucose-1-phosphate cytidylyltransferase